MNMYDENRNEYQKEEQNGGMADSGQKAEQEPADSAMDVNAAAAQDPILGEDSTAKEPGSMSENQGNVPEEHQYRYGRSFYQNQQDSVYHMNGSAYQGNSWNHNSMGQNQNNRAENQNMNAGSMHQNVNYTQAEGFGGQQAYGQGANEPHVQQPPEKKKTPNGRRTAVKIGKAAACIAIVVVVAAGSAFGTTLWLEHRAANDSGSASIFNRSSRKSSTTVPVSTVSSSTAIVTDVSEVVENAMPSVVKITNVGTQTYNGFFGGTYSYESNGSGIIIGQTDEELLVVTNQHVVAGADTLQVIFINEESCEANVKGTDAEKDLAVIAVPKSSLDEETLNAIRVATLGDSDNVKIGEPAIAIGNALGYGQSVTLGIISAKDREITTENYTSKLIQTDAAINPGNSGGALLNMAGEVIGINSVKYSSTEVEGMGYAIPISDATPIINELMSKETKTKVDEDEKSYIGISGLDITSDVAQAYNMPKGVYVAQVTKNGPADKAGIKKGDIITKIADVSVTSYDELKAELEYHAAGTTVQVELLTQSENSYGYESKKIEVTLARKK